MNEEAEHLRHNRLPRRHPSPLFDPHAQKLGSTLFRADKTLTRGKRTVEKQGVIWLSTHHEPLHCP